MQLLRCVSGERADFRTRQRARFSNSVAIRLMRYDAHAVRTNRCAAVTVISGQTGDWLSLSKHFADVIAKIA